MGRLLRALACLALVLVSPFADAEEFERLFDGRTMRVDYFHTGGKGVEIVAIDQVVNDGPWPGSRTRLVDTTNYGEFMFEVIDVASGKVVYSRGFSSIFGEWVTTPESKGEHRTFHESLRFPWPKANVKVVLRKRGEDRQSFVDVWSTTIDPNSRFVNAATLTLAPKVWAVHEGGPPATNVDLALIAEGYAADDMKKFRADAKRLTDALFSVEPFKSRKGDFNVWAIESVSGTSGVHQPRSNQPRRTPVSAVYNAFDSERYILTFDNKAMRDVAAAAPYEFVEILVNEEQYGGGGIYNFQATTCVDSGFTEYVFVHEFGHHFAALADEYYTSDVAYETGKAEHREPWEPNITAMHDPAKLKWKDLVAEGTALPTPWPKEEFEKRSAETQKIRRELRDKGAPEAEIDELFRKERVWNTKMLGTGPHAAKVGAFEGAGYEAKGLYRPQADCMMFTRDDVGFCKVCSRAIEMVIDQYSK
ncbi:MAG: IgA Peptidase M64 [Thermoanaerobaculia bacterium]|nr:IgA Peptidase M64 [Thermoanaerobaculia bacterium]